MPRWLLLVPGLFCALEEFVQQHRIYRVVAHSDGFAIAVTCHQLGINLFDLLSNQTEAKRPGRFNLRLVSKAHGPEAVYRFTDLLHRLDFVFETLRGHQHPQFSIRIHIHRLGAARPRPDVADVATVTLVFSTDADTNNICGCSDTSSGSRAQRGVEAAGHVVEERVLADSCVLVSGRVRHRSGLAERAVSRADEILLERRVPIGFVIAPGSVALERHFASSRVGVAFGVINEGSVTDGRVGVADSVLG